MTDGPKYVPKPGERVKVVLAMWGSEVEYGPGYFVRIEPVLPEPDDPRPKVIK